MALETADEVFEKALALPDEEQERLLKRLEIARRVRSQKPEVTPGRHWHEIRGIAPNLLGGEDAQEWVTRTRREADETRSANRDR
jgi:hypothetical protein